MLHKVSLLLSFIFFSLRLFSQNENECFVFNSPTMTFYGVDFSMVKFRNVNAAGFNDPVKIRDSYFNVINSYFLESTEKINLSYVFDKIIFINLEKSNSRNLTTNITNNVVDAEAMLKEDDINSIIADYPFDSSKSELGVLLIAQQLNKVKDGSDNSYGDYRLVFFKNSNHTILLSMTISGMAGGMGWANFWWKSIYKAFDEVKMKKLKKVYCPSK